MEYYKTDAIVSMSDLMGLLRTLNKYNSNDVLCTNSAFMAIYIMYFGFLVALYFMFSTNAEIVVFLFLAFIAFISQFNKINYIVINEERLLFHKFVVALPKFSEPGLQSLISEMDRYLEKWDPEEKNFVFSFSLKWYEQYKESFFGVAKREGEK